jgi:hypothetical protein
MALFGFVFTLFLTQKCKSPPKRFGFCPAFQQCAFVGRYICTTAEILQNATPCRVSEKSGHKSLATPESLHRLPTWVHTTPDSSAVARHPCSVVAACRLLHGQPHVANFFRRRCLWGAPSLSLSISLGCIRTAWGELLQSVFTSVELSCPDLSTVWPLLDAARWRRKKAKGICALTEQMQPREGIGFYKYRFVLENVVERRNRFLQGKRWRGFVLEKESVFTSIDLRSCLADHNSLKVDEIVLFFVWFKKTNNSLKKFTCHPLYVFR